MKLIRHNRMYAITGLLLTIGGAVLWADRHISRVTRDACFDDPDLLPARRVGLVLGTSSRLTSGAENPYYRYRIEAAAALFRYGKVEYLLLSGDHGRMAYNEPMDMTRDLVAAGVPMERIYRDYGGFRTLDSVARAKHVFGLGGFVLVSQRFHNERAIYLARSYGVDAVAFNARDVQGANSVRTRVRERIARLAAVIDLKILHTRPKFYGHRIEIGVDPAV